VTVHCSIRASTLKQEASPEVQKAQIKAYCDAQDWKEEPRLIYPDPATTSKIPFLERAAGSQLHAALQRGDRVIFTKLDRGFRNTREFLSVMEIWERLGVKVHIINFMGGNAIDFSSPVGKFCLTIMAAAAEFERATIAERTREALRHIRAKGVSVGQPRFGFNYVKVTMGDKVRRRAVPDKEERKQMSEILRLRTEDPPYSWDEIRIRLNYELKWYRTKKWGEFTKNREWSIPAIQRACKAERLLRDREAQSRRGVGELSEQTEGPS
jgi:putative DNA-invertase from lambdoid prophage Rac